MERPAPKRVFSLGGEAMGREEDHKHYMEIALVEAENAGKRGDLPIGAVIVHKGQIIAKGSNKRNTKQSIVAHAEIEAIHACAPFLKEHYKECVIYTTLEPCIMCLSTIVTANITSIYFGAEDRYLEIATYIKSASYVRERLTHYEGGLLKEESENLLRLYSPEMAKLVLNTP